MEIAEIYYKAKDGKMFTDPLECENYEKTIGVVAGSVGDLIRTLEKEAKPTDYVLGIVMVRLPDGTANIYTRCTVCIDDKLEDYVNVNSLSKEQRYETTTVERLVEPLKHEDKDLPCQYMLLFSENIDMHESTIMSCYNKSVWKKDENKK